MKFKTTEAKKLFGYLKAAIGNNSIIHFLGNSVVTKKDEIFVSVGIEDIDIYGSFPSTPFLKALQSIQDDDFYVKFVGDNLQIKSKNTLCEIPVLDEEITEEVSIIEESFEYDWFESPKGFMEDLKLAADVSSKDLRDGSLSCVMFGKNDKIQASNNFRAVVIDTKSVRKHPDILVGANSVKKLSKEPISHLSFDSNFLHMYSDITGITQTLILVEEDFPDIAGMIEKWKPEKTNKTIPILFTKEFSKCINEMIPFCEGKDMHEKTILCTFKEKTIELFSKNEQASMTKKVENRTGVNDLEFTITPSVLSSLILNGNCFIHDDKLFFSSKNITYVVGL